MQKKLIALAIAGAFAAPAFAATSNVDIYGKMHFSVNYYQDQPSSIADLNFTSNASRIGFKGAEDLGGGLSAIWQVESGINGDEGNGTWASRNTFLGLSSKDFGTFLIGKHDTPLKLVGRAVDLFGDTQADSRNVMGGGSDTRTDNTVAWVSPSWSGFAIAAAYVTDLANTSTSGDRDDYDAWNLNATYTNGPIYIGVGYGDGDGHEALGLDEQWRVAGAFDMGNFRFVGQYDSLSADTDSKGDYDAWMVGAQYKTGAWTIKGNYMDGDYDNATDPTQWTIGVDYSLSKRTTVYALYADGENVVMGSGGGTSDRVGYSPSAAVGASDEDISVISLGITHTF
jgi:predicted porin